MSWKCERDWRAAPEPTEWNGGGRQGAGAGAEPPWRWTASWEMPPGARPDPRDPSFWSEAWKRMRDWHRFITPAELQVEPLPGGGSAVRATWVSSPAPMGPHAMAQGPEIYSAWYKGADSWPARVPQAPVPPGGGRAWRGPGQPW